MKRTSGSFSKGSFSWHMNVPLGRFGGKKVQRDLFLGPPHPLTHVDYMKKARTCVLTFFHETNLRFVFEGFGHFPGLVMRI